ncbi:heterokaryon incompatibility protein-domain-containing protein [Rhypophila decipiens]|uniref:Heterokaryon incompatibility protein-domain-containing protein n=1 Tax=Rhypophila decipiens TaxID=261697 RepID=A0AAN6Y1C9_9PEZI|nr:heterokaryon incompatibility protein-domain-containing protein [Rhypophila decipiens]
MFDKLRIKIPTYARRVLRRSTLNDILNKKDNQPSPGSEPAFDASLKSYSSPANSYQYTPLSTSAGEIRLLKLLPSASPEDPLCIEISHHKLSSPTEQISSPRSSLASIRASLPDRWTAHEALYLDGRIMFHNKVEIHSSWTHPDPNVSGELKEPSSVQQQPELEPKYEALSYAWGSSGDKESALVFDPHNADRDPKCLSLRENLASALKHLRRPDLSRLLWVDAICIDQANLEERGEQVRRMGDIFALATRAVVWLGPASETSSLAFSVLRNYGGQVVPPPPEDCDKGTWQVIEDLCQRSWFHRLWVLQEIQLANTSSILQCGEDSIPWPVFRSAIELLTSHAFDATAQRFSKAHRALVICLPMVDLPLDALLLDNTSRKCSDDRDRIYEILSMAPPRFRASFVSDYTASVADVYKAAFIHHVHTTGRLTFLPMVNQRGEPGWNTWVPDFRQNSYLYYSLLGAGFCACSLSGAEMKQVSTRSIEIPGIIVDTVSRIRPLDAINSFADLRNMLETAGLERLQSSLYAPNTSLLDAYLSTLAFGTFREWMSHEYYPTLDQWKDIVKGLWPWLARAHRDEDRHHRVRFCRTAPDGKEELQMSDDPRPSEIPVPKPWQPLEAIRTRDDPTYFCRFENTETGEVINYDPRLSASSLRERGCPGRDDTTGLRDEI